MNERQEHAFAQLLAAWRRHDESQHAHIDERAEARFALDRARTEMMSATRYR